MTIVDDAPPAEAQALPIPNQHTPPPGRAVIDPQRIPRVLTSLHARLDATRSTNIGFPSTLDLDVTPLMPFFNELLNNVGDPDLPSLFPAHTKELEREVVDIVADLLHAPAEDRWGYVTTGGSEGIEYGLLLARTLHPDTIAFFSSSAHWSVAKICSRLRIPTVVVRSLPDGCMDLSDLHTVLRAHRRHAAVVVGHHRHHHDRGPG